MRDATNLADLPEAVPLRRVSPLWRVLAILAGLGLIGLGMLTCVLLAALARIRAQQLAELDIAPICPPPIHEREPLDPSQLPYPVQADWAAEHSPDEEQPEGARSRFLRRGSEVWRDDRRLEPRFPRVSADGTVLAFVAGDRLWVGPFDNVQPTRFPDPLLSRPTGVHGAPAWAPGNVLCFASDGGRLWWLRPQAAYPEQVRQLGNWPAVLGSSFDENLVCVRSIATPKVEGLEPSASADPVEVVWLRRGRRLVLIPKSAASWTQPVLSPRGQRLAIVSDQTEEEKRGGWRIFVIDLPAAGGEPAEPRPVTAPAAQVAGVCWRPDGKGLVYARSVEPAPPDHFEAGVPRVGLYRGCDLFELDLETGRETRLSRGGGFYSPSMSEDGQLFFAAWRAGAVAIFRLPGNALEHARREPEPPPRDAAAWTRLLDGVRADCPLPAEADGGHFTPELLARLADAFARRYEQQFGQPLPTSAGGLGLLQEEIAGLELPRPARDRFTLVFGAVCGEHLRRRHDAAWQLAPGPLLPTRGAEERVESAFGYLVNPFELAALLGDEYDGFPLEFALRQAQGRPIMLVNDPATGRKLLDERRDPRLDQANDAFRQDRPEEADRLLLEMMQAPRHARNTYLLLKMGKLLYEHDRRSALRQLMTAPCAQPPRDPRKFNLLGLACLETQPDRAVEAFRNALRCDLYYGPAYLNLAQAYERRDNRFAAQQCLLRYLELMPHGALADDARRRLAALAD
jgi:hypothetical protein